MAISSPTGQTKRIEFWFDFASTYSYPAAMRIEALAASRGVTVSWRAFALAPIFSQQGWKDSLFNISPPRGRYMWRDLARICQDLDLPLKRPSVFPRNSIPVARIACEFAEAAWLPDFVRAVYSASFEQDQDIAEPSVIEQCLIQAGQNPSACIEQTLLPASKGRLRAQTEAAMAHGIFGAPSVIVGNELFWGNDRLEQALAWCVRDAQDGSQR